MMPETIEQFAARVLARYRETPGPAQDVLPAVIVAELPAFLAQHRQVVEVTGDELSIGITAAGLSLQYPAGSRYDEVLAYRNTAASYISNLIRARAVPAADVCACSPIRSTVGLSEAVMCEKCQREAAAPDPAPASRPALDVEKLSKAIAALYFDDPAISVEDAARSVLREAATDTGWVHCPTQTAGELKTPQKMGVTDGLIVVDWSGEKQSQIMPVGNWIIAANCHRWCVPGQPWIERTPTTTRAWTAESVQACVGREVATVDQQGSYDVHCWDEMSDSAIIAMSFSDRRIVRYHLLPQDGPR